MKPEQLAAMEQALEALIASDDFLFNYHYCEPNNEREMDSYSLIRINNLASVTALRTIIEQAKRQQALDKMAENERELGIQMQPESVDFFDWYDNAIWGNEDFKAGCQRAWDAALEYAAPAALVQLAWVWQQAPVKTQWGHDMVVADLAIDKDHTVSIYCELDQTSKVEAMFTPPAAPVQEPVAWRHDMGEENGGWEYFEEASCPECQPLYTSPPASKPLTDEQIMEMYNEPRSDAEMIAFARAIEQKLREKNGGAA